MEIWKHTRQVSAVRQESILRLQAGAPFLLGIDSLDIDILPQQGGRIRFTFFWTDAWRWEGRDFEVAVRGS
jgi:hypothetical protein